MAWSDRLLALPWSVPQVSLEDAVGDDMDDMEEPDGFGAFGGGGGGGGYGAPGASAPAQAAQPAPQPAPQPQYRPAAQFQQPQLPQQQQQQQQQQQPQQQQQQFQQSVQGQPFLSNTAAGGSQFQSPSQPSLQPGTPATNSVSNPLSSHGSGGSPQQMPSPARDDGKDLVEVLVALPDDLANPLGVIVCKLSHTLARARMQVSRCLQLQSLWKIPTAAVS